MPLWTPDGTQVTFLANDALWNIAADFGEAPQLLSTTSHDFGISGPLSWSPDGRVLFSSGAPDVAQFTLLEAGEVQHGAVLDEPYAEEDASFSADGAWFSYTTSETGFFEVYVQPYPLGSGPKRRITQGGGDDPVWSRSGRELFYLDDGQLWAVGIETDSTLTWQDPVALFETRWPTEWLWLVNYDVTSDGQRFVFVQPASDDGNEERNQINVVLNWTQELLERVPVN